MEASGSCLSQASIQILSSILYGEASADIARDRLGGVSNLTAEGFDFTLEPGIGLWT